MNRDQLLGGMTAAQRAAYESPWLEAGRLAVPREIDRGTYLALSVNH